MTWIIIFVVMALAIGPIFYLLPTRRDKYLTALRAEARALGFVVQLEQVPKLDPSADELVSAGGAVRLQQRNCTRYQLPVGKTLVGIPTLRMLRVPEQPTRAIYRLSDNWCVVHDDPAQARAVASWRSHAALLARVLSLLDDLPADVIGVELENRLVAAFMLEKQPGDMAASDGVDGSKGNVQFAHLYAAQGVLKALIEQLKTW